MYERPSNCNEGQAYQVSGDAVGPTYVLRYHIVITDTVNQFKNKLDKYWENYDFVYDHRTLTLSGLERFS